MLWKPLLFSVTTSSLILKSHELHYTGLPCPSLFLWAYSNSYPLRWWCYQTISSSAAHFSFCFQSFPASGSFLMSWLFTSDSQSIGASASASGPSNEYSGLISLRIDWFDLLVQRTLKSLLQKTTGGSHQFFGTQPSLWSNSHIHTWLLEKP